MKTLIENRIKNLRQQCEALQQNRMMLEQNLHTTDALLNGCQASIATLESLLKESGDSAGNSVPAADQAGAASAAG